MNETPMGAPKEIPNLHSILDTGPLIDINPTDENLEEPETQDETEPTVEEVTEKVTDVKPAPTRTTCKSSGFDDRVT